MPTPDSSEDHPPFSPDAGNPPVTAPWEHPSEPPAGTEPVDEVEQRLPSSQPLSTPLNAPLYPPAEQSEDPAYPPYPTYPYARPRVVYPSPFYRQARVPLRTIITAAVTLAIIGTCAGTGYFAYSRAKAIASQEQRTLDVGGTVAGFCFDLREQDYNDAYVFLAPSLRAKLSLDDFVAGSQLRDQVDGVVTECREPASGGHLTTTATTGTDRIEVIRNGKQTAGTLNFVRQGSDWKISAIDSTLDVE